MIPVLGLVVGIVLGLVLSPEVPVWIAPYLPIAVIAALDAVRPGPEGREIDAVARDMIAAAGHGEHFGHGLGHGVGIEVHEAPRLARTGKDALVAGNVVTVEPGIYLPGAGGVRIEDLVVVTERGRDVLTSTTKDLITVG